MLQASAGVFLERIISKILKNSHQFSRDLLSPSEMDLAGNVQRISSGVRHLKQCPHTLRQSEF